MSTSDFNAAMHEFLADPDRTKFAQSGDPHSWQQQFEDRIEAIGAQGAALTEQIQQVEAEAKDRHLGVRVGAGGTLLGLVFGPGAAKATAAQLSEAFMAQYRAAGVDVQAQVQEIVAGSGLPTTDFDPFTTADAEEA